MGVKFCSELKRLTLDVLKDEFGGKTGTNLYELCRGIDKRKVCLQIYSSFCFKTQRVQGCHSFWSLRLVFKISETSEKFSIV